MSDTTISEINVAYPDLDALHLKLAIGACRATVRPGAADWVSGTYEHPAEALPAKITEDGGTFTISQDYSTVLNMIGAFGQKPPTFDLQFGDAHPYRLSLEGGASEAEYDLGGLPLTRLSVKQGAGKLSIDFSAANPEAMTLFEIAAGAIDLEVTNLANANFAQMKIDGGAASYRFDFGGVLMQDAFVKIDAGMAGVELRIPSTTAAKIEHEGALASVELGDGFTRKEGAFWTEAALAGEGPVLTIEANVSVGSVSLRSY